MKRDKENIEIMNESLTLGKIKKSSLTTEECQKSSIESSLKGLQNAFKNFKKSIDTETLLTMELELDLLKGRVSEPIGSEKIWSGVTYVKTATGWKPKGKRREPKPEEAPSNRVPKIEEPSIPKEKQIESFAEKAKDSQLEAAIKDPKQDEEVKKIAKEELEKRKGDSSENKTTEKTQPEKENTTAEKPVEKENRENNIEELKLRIQKHLSDPEISKDYNSTLKSLRDEYKIAIEKKTLPELVSDLNAETDRVKILAINEILVENEQLPYCSPIFYESYENEEYKVFTGDLFNAKEAHKYFNKQKRTKRSSKASKAIGSYLETGFSLLNGYSLNGNVDEYDLEWLDEDEDSTTFEFFSGATQDEANDIAKNLLKEIDTYIDEQAPIPENVILSRRVSDMEDVINSLNISDTFEMKSLQSFSLIPIESFGEIQITLIVKKGTKGVAPIGNKDYEMEYLTKTNSKARVVSKGYNSIAIELI